MWLICGKGTDSEDFFKIKLEMTNVRRGMSVKDDGLPAKVMGHKRGGKNAWAENLPPLGAMLNEYYSYRGWGDDGIPTGEKLTERRESVYPMRAGM